MAYALLRMLEKRDHLCIQPVINLVEPMSERLGGTEYDERDRGEQQCNTE
jgi:hypothetical protein